jgi:hypothetical protein
MKLAIVGGYLSIMLLSGNASAAEHWTCFADTGSHQTSEWQIDEFGHRISQEGSKEEFKIVFNSPRISIAHRRDGDVSNILLLEREGIELTQIAVPEGNARGQISHLSCRPH